MVTKKRPTLAKRFKCPFCSNENAVECAMDRKNAIGKLNCRLCGASYQMGIHNLHEPIDVFSEWLDDCEAAERLNGSSAGAGGLPSGVSGNTGKYDEEYDRVDDEKQEKKSNKHKAPTNTTSIGLDSYSDEE